MGVGRDGGATPGAEGTVPLGQRLAYIHRESMGLRTDARGIERYVVVWIQGRELRAPSSENRRR